MLDDTAPIEFFVGPIPGDVVFPEGTPGYTHTLGVNTPATACSGDDDAPVFSLNGVAAADGITRGGIKGACMSSPVGGGAERIPYGGTQAACPAALFSVW